MPILPNIRRLIAGSLIPRAVLRPALYRCVCVRQRRICKGLVKRQQRLSAGRTADGRCPLRQLAYAELEYYLQPLRQENRKFKSVGTLMGIYYKPVGGSAPLLLNVSPSKNGVIPLIDTLTCKAFGDRIRGEFSDSAGQSVTIGNNESLQPKDALNARLTEDSSSDSFGGSAYIPDCRTDGKQQVSSVVRKFFPTKPLSMPIATKYIRLRQ